MSTTPTGAATKPAPARAAAIPYDGALTCAINVADLDRSIAWYKDVLGFDLLYRLDDNGWAELRTNVQNVNIGLGKSDKPHAAGGATLTFGVTDIEAAKSALDHHHIRQDGPIRTIPGMVRLLTAFDPDDNAVMFYQGLPPERHD